MFDRCGVCDGDGTSCIGKRLTYKGFPNPMKGKRIAYINAFGLTVDSARHWDCLIVKY